MQWSTNVHQLITYQRKWNNSYSECKWTQMHYQGNTSNINAIVWLGSYIQINIACNGIQRYPIKFSIWSSILLPYVKSGHVEEYNEICNSDYRSSIIDIVLR